MVKERTEEPGVLQSVGVTKGWTQLNNNSLSAVFGLDSWAIPRSSSLPPLLLKPMENGHRNTWVSSQPPWASCSYSPSTCYCPQRPPFLRSGGFPQKQAMQTLAPLIRSAHSLSEFWTLWFCWLDASWLKDSGHVGVPALCQVVPTASCPFVIWVFLAVPSQRWHPSRDPNPLEHASCLLRVLSWGTAVGHCETKQMVLHSALCFPRFVFFRFSSCLERSLPGLQRLIRKQDKSFSKFLPHPIPQQISLCRSRLATGEKMPLDISHLVAFPLMLISSEDFVAHWLQFWGPLPSLPAHRVTPTSLCWKLINSVQSLSRVQLFVTPGLEHARLPCLSPTPGVYSNSCPSSRWCHPTISSSVIPFSPTFNLTRHQGLFQWVGSLHQMTKVLELQLQHQSFQWIFRTDFF